MVDFHRNAFDEGTTTKLALFSAYAKEWLPVFLSPKSTGSTVTIVDFFAGPGRDVHGQAGSPLLLLRTIREYTELIRNNSIHVRLELNERVKRKAKILHRSMEEQKIPADLCEWHIHSLEFDDAFTEIYPKLRAGPNLLVLDQQGIRFISDVVLQKLVALQRTDFLFFIASSFVRRFLEHPHFKKHLPIPSDKITGREFLDIHRAVTDYYRGLVESKQQFFIAPFSIRKGSNIYGVIFGSAHPLGIEKFLRVCWSLDTERGEANFDIDGDSLDENAPYLFPEMNIPSKITKFEEHLKQKLMSRTLQTDGDVYIECLKEGMLPKHGRSVLRGRIGSGVVRTTCGRLARVSKDGLREPRTLEIESNGPVKD